MSSRVEKEIQPYDSDHTALVHVLWQAQRGGITISDADALASLIMQSKWMRAVRLHARERVMERNG
jgi:hypothetical protein